MSLVAKTSSNGPPAVLPLTPPIFYILFSLAEGQKHGYAIMQNVSKISGGGFRMGPATLYTTIQKLLELQFIDEVQSSAVDPDQDSRRRYYELTRSGRAALASELKRMESLVRIARDMKLARASE